MRSKRTVVSHSDPRVDQSHQRGLIIPVDLRFRGIGVVIAAGDHRPQWGGQTGIGGEQAPDGRANQGDGVHGGDRASRDDLLLVSAIGHATDVEYQILTKSNHNLSENNHFE